MAENKYIPDSEGVLVQHFTPEAQKSKPSIAGDIKNLVGKLFSKATQDTKASDLGRNDSRKEGEQVYTTDMGAIETGVSNKPISSKEETPVSFTPPAADHVKYEEMAEAIKNGPTSPNEDKERQIVIDQEAKARAAQEEQKRAQEEAEKNARVAGDPSGLQAYQDKTEELRDNAFNPTSWMEKEKSDTENIMRGTAERDIAERAASEGADGDKIRADLYKTGNYQDLESVDEAARRIEDQIARDKKSKEPIFADDSASKPSLTQSDRNPSVIAAEDAVDKELGDQAADRILRHADEQRAVEKDQAEVDRTLGDEAAKRILRHADEQRAAEKDQADKEASGKRWAALDTDRPYPTDADGNPIRPMDSFTGAYGDEARDRIVEDTLQGADAIGDRINRPIEPGEIIVRRNPNKATLTEADEDPEVTEQRDRIRDRSRRAAPRWRRALVAAGLVALLFIPHDRGPANPVAEVGALPKIEAPYVPMPELPKEPRTELSAFPETAPTSPLDGLPKKIATFPTEGPGGENISTKQADLGGWFDAEWVKNYKATHPDQFSNQEFDMRNIYDGNLLRTLQNSPDYQTARELFLQYPQLHDITTGSPDQRINVYKKPDGSIDKVLISVPSSSAGIEVPDVAALAKYVANLKGT